MPGPSLPSDLRITLAQLNPVVGDVLGNTVKIRETYLEADARGADLVITPELGVTGHPLGALADAGDLPAAADAALRALARATRSRRAALVVGAPLDGPAGVHSAAVVLADGGIRAVARQKSPPGGGVSDETRGLEPDAGASGPFPVRGIMVGLLVRDDVWKPEPARELLANGAQVLVSIDASPFRPRILEARVREAAAKRVAETGLPLVYLNMVGGQDEAVFDGGSFIMDAAGRRRLQLPRWEECSVDCDLSEAGLSAAAVERFPDPLEERWRAMMLGVGDYVRKSGFTDVVLGLSGGMDSALVAAVAGDALGPERVHCVRLPSRHTSDLSNDAARDMCEAWGFGMDTLPIGAVVSAAESTLAPVAPGGLKSLTLENMQARARGYLLMTLSNDRGWLLLATGNKSEIAVGYATLYGDMCGGFNPLKDVFKTTVFELGRWRNANRPAGLLGPEGEAIPTAILDRPPSAELAPDQKDTDSLPPYPVLDAVLEEMMEKRTPLPEIVRKGHPPEMVARVYRMLKRAEYKRRQGAPGLKAGDWAFAGDRRMPIVNGFDPGMVAELERL